MGSLSNDGIHFFTYNTEITNKFFGHTVYFNTGFAGRLLQYTYKISR